MRGIIKGSGWVRIRDQERICKLRRCMADYAGVRNALKGEILEFSHKYRTLHCTVPEILY